MEEVWTFAVDNVSSIMQKKPDSIELFHFHKVDKWFEEWTF